MSQFYRTISVAALVLFLCSHLVRSLNILLIPAVGISHLIYFGNLGKELQSRGHNITLLTNSRISIPADLKELPWKRYPVDTDPAYAKKLMALVPENAMKGNSMLMNLRIVTQHVTLFENEAEQLFQDEATLDFLSSSKFDFVITDFVPTLMGVPYMLKVPFAYFVTECFPWHSRAPVLPSFVPHPLSPSSERMTLPQRMLNAVIYFLLTPLCMSVPNPADYLPEHVLPTSGEHPSASDLIGNASFCFRLSDRVLDVTRALNPNMLNLGNVMAREGRRLPADLHHLISQAEEGVIIMSFGSVFSLLDKDALQKFVHVFNTVKMTFIWKSDGVVEDLPANVHQMSWMPQNDLLAHPNVKLFITHAGINSLLEAVHHGMPQLLFPLGIDQVGNAERARSKGYGEVLQFHTFTAEELVANIEKILAGNYSATVRAAGEFMRQFPPAGETASFWIDHVVRHGEMYTRPYSQDMVWYEYLMLDIALIFLLILSIIVYLAFRFVRFVTFSVFIQRPKYKTS